MNASSSDTWVSSLEQGALVDTLPGREQPGFRACLCLTVGWCAGGQAATWLGLARRARREKGWGPLLSVCYWSALAGCLLSHMRTSGTLSLYVHLEGERCKVLISALEIALWRCSEPSYSPCCAFKAVGHLFYTACVTFKRTVAWLQGELG